MERGRVIRVIIGCFGLVVFFLVINHLFGCAEAPRRASTITVVNNVDALVSLEFGGDVPADMPLDQYAIVEHMVPGQTITFSRPFFSDCNEVTVIARGYSQGEKEYLGVSTHVFRFPAAYNYGHSYGLYGYRRSQQSQSESVWRVNELTPPGQMFRR